MVFGGHPRGGELSQLVVDEREQVRGGLAIAGRGGIEEVRDFGHADEFNRGVRRDHPKMWASPHPHEGLATKLGWQLAATTSLRRTGTMQGIKDAVQRLVAGSVQPRKETTLFDDQFDEEKPDDNVGLTYVENPEIEAEPQPEFSADGFAEEETPSANHAEEATDPAVGEVAPSESAMPDDRDALLMFLLLGLRARVYGDASASTFSGNRRTHHHKTRYSHTPGNGTRGRKCKQSAWGHRARLRTDPSPR